MEVLSNKISVIKVIFLVCLDLVTNDERKYETLLFNCKEDAIIEYEAQLNKIKTDKTSWECVAIREALGGNNSDQEPDSMYTLYENDYLAYFETDLSYLLNHPNWDLVLKEFAIYENYGGDPYELSTCISLRAYCILGKNND